MKQLIGLVIWAIAMAMPALNAQEPSPGKTAMVAPRRIAKPTVTHVNVTPQPTVHPTKAIVANHKVANTNRGKGTNEKAANTDRANVANEKIANTSRGSYAEAMRHCEHDRHDREWWRKHYVVIVLVGGGYYYWNSGYWYPAWGYDPYYQNYDYNGPIYTYNNLLPDQVVINVQHALQELGYYTGSVTGSLGVSTRQALSAYQADNGLDVTGAVDEETVRALGLFEG